jgi:hypothetical protein
MIPHFSMGRKHHCSSIARSIEVWLSLEAMVGLKVTVGAYAG